ncbi:P43 [Clanis bilineata nucleopolyhedrovirus]|uniref:p43 n=1 Tax=Clanis bilineata nucleopolyhedrovirus TaxID=1307957 RepID=Q0N406_9ABAC|nr:P43 [Clanis bilineata nucleopolyhedrovirus]ABF47437.1 P43 [Clanis bilineata nucleopolyhedrovirus]
MDRPCRVGSVKPFLFYNEDTWRGPKRTNPFYTCPRQHYGISFKLFDTNLKLSKLRPHQRVQYFFDYCLPNKFKCRSHMYLMNERVMNVFMPAGHYLNSMQYKDDLCFQEWLDCIGSNSAKLVFVAKQVLKRLPRSRAKYNEIETFIEKLFGGLFNIDKQAFLRTFTMFAQVVHRHLNKRKHNTSKYIIFVYMALDMYVRKNLYLLAGDIDVLFEMRQLVQIYNLNLIYDYMQKVLQRCHCDTLFDTILLQMILRNSYDHKNCLKLLKMPPLSTSTIQKIKTISDKQLFSSRVRDWCTMYTLVKRQNRFVYNGWDKQSLRVLRTTDLTHKCILFIKVNKNGDKIVTELTHNRTSQLRTKVKYKLNNM